MPKLLLTNVLIWHFTPDRRQLKRPQAVPFISLITILKGNNTNLVRRIYKIIISLLFISHKNSTFGCVTCIHLDFETYWAFFFCLEKRSQTGELETKARN